MSRVTRYSLFGLLLGGLAPVAALHASESSYPSIDSCQAEANRHYGKETPLRIVSKRRTAQGLQVRLSAQLDKDNAEFLVCWIPREQGPDQSNALAARIAPVPQVR